MKIMIDSGAFSVWNSGKSVDLDDYIRFCKGCPVAGAFVNLDVIPGTPKRKAGNDEREEACKQSWANYRKMIKTIPEDKVIPVFHHDENPKWLEKYLDFGCPYVGIGGISDRGGLDWVKSIAKRLLDGSGKPLAKIHGFAAGSHEIMACFPWHSVDSTTWARHAQVWQALVPKTKGGKWDYARTPFVVKLSPRAKVSQQNHIDCLTPTVKQMVLKYIRENGMELGENELIECPAGYKKENGEYWLDKAKKKVVRTVKPGIRTDVNLRGLLNARLYQKSAEAIGVPEYYLSAMAGVPDWIEEAKCVLLSFGNVPKGFDEWLR